MGKPVPRGPVSIWTQQRRGHSRARIRPSGGVHRVFAATRVARLVRRSTTRGGRLPLLKLRQPRGVAHAGVWPALRALRGPLGSLLTRIPTAVRRQILPLGPVKRSHAQSIFNGWSTETTGKTSACVFRSHGTAVVIQPPVGWALGATPRTATPPPKSATPPADGRTPRPRTPATRQRIPHRRADSARVSLRAQSPRRARC